MCICIVCLMSVLQIRTKKTKSVSTPSQNREENSLVSFLKEPVSGLAGFQTEL